jgi:hypothetical protein
VDARPARHRPSPRRHTIAVGAAVAVALAVSGCGANFGAETERQYNPAPGGYHRTGPIYLLDALVVANNNGSGVLAGTLTNQGARPDELMSVTIVGTGGVEPATLAHGPIPIAPGAAVQLLKGSGVRVASASLKPGYSVTMKFAFKDAASFTLGVPVLPRSGYLSTVTIPTNGSTSSSTP